VIYVRVAKENQNNTKIDSTMVTKQLAKSKQRGRLQSSQQQAANKSKQASNQAKLDPRDLEQ